MNVIEYESSSRLPVLVMGVALVALAFAPSAHAAGGSPVPVPDDPPPGVALTRAKIAQPVATPRATNDVAATPAAPAPVPTPDAPPTPAVAQKAAPEAPRPRGEATEQAVPASGVSRPSAARVAVRPTPAPLAAAVPAAVATTKPPPAVARSERRAPRAKRPTPPVSKPKPLATRMNKVAEPVTRLPHDALRLGLPVGALIVGRPGSDPDTGLLVLAALLLAVAAAGTFVLGFAARGAARHA